MYPRNAASPQPIAIGAVLLIADGTVQTSGVTVRVKPIGVSEADGDGTVAYSTNGIVIYTPTQAETDYTSFVVIATKTSCIPVSINVVTTASEIAGTVSLNNVNGNVVDGPDDFKADVSQLLTITDQISGMVTQLNQLPNVEAVTNKLDGMLMFDGSVYQWTANSLELVDKTGYSLTAITGLGNQTANITGNLSGSVGSVTGAVGSVTGNVGGNVTGSVGSVLGNVAGSVNSVTSAVTVGVINAGVITATSIATGAFTSAKFAAGAFDAVWSVAVRTLTTVADSSGVTTLLSRIGSVLTISSGKVTVGTNDDKTGYGLAADQAVNVTKVGGTTVAGPNDLKANVSGISAVTEKLDAMLALDGSVYQWTANSLELAPTGSGGGGHSAATIYTYFTEGTRADAFKADVSGLSTFDHSLDTVTVGTNNDKTDYMLAADQEVNITKVSGTAVSSPDDFKADVSGFNSLLMGINDSLQVVAYDVSQLPGNTYGFFTQDSNANAFKADVSGLSTFDSATDQVIVPPYYTPDEIVRGIITGTVPVGSLASDIQTLSSKFAGITVIRNWLAVIMGKTADAPTLAEVNATTAANNYNNVTDSQEAIRDRGDAAWTGGGGSGGGSGGTNYQITVTSNGDAEEGVAVWVSTDDEGTNVVAGTIYTNALGIVEFALDDLDYYVWVRKSRINFLNPTFMSNSPIAINGTAATANPDIESGVCELSLTLYSQGTTEIVPLVGVSVTAKMPADYAIRNSIIHFNVVDVAATDSEGFALLKLVQNTVYDIYVTTGNSIKARKLRITTPATQTANLSELI